MHFAVWSLVAICATLIAPCFSHWNKEDFFVDGKHIPGINFTVSDSYAGLLPISNKHNASQLFFWYWPAQNEGKEDLVFYNSGGPGCSGLASQLGMLGPFILPNNMVGAVPNNYSWTQLSHIVFLDYPVGVGLSVGKPSIRNEQDLAIEWYGFITTFFTTFPELKNKRLWLSGMSYAGISMPYIIDYIAQQEEQGKNAAIGINYSGFSLTDPYIVNDVVAQDIASVDFALKNKDIMRLSTTFLNDLITKAKKLGAYGFMKTNLHFPTSEKGKIAIPSTMWTSNYSLYNAVYDAAYDANPCISVYDVRLNCPIQFDQIRRKDFVNSTPGFRQYIHADPTRHWSECASNDYIFVDGRDPSPPPADTDLLERILNHPSANRNVIAHGEFDFLLIADGTAVALENTTWSNKQGYQDAPKPFYVDAKEAGVMQNERGLLFARIANSGHNVARNTPAVAYKLQQYMLGQVTAEEMQS